jgi:hypothetical protein
LSKFPIDKTHLSESFAPVGKWLRICKPRIRETDSGGKENGMRGIRRIFYIFSGMI